MKKRKGRSEDELNDCLRPSALMDFAGQKENKNNLKIFMDASKARGESLDHVLLYGPPGLGKTTMASIIAKYMGGELIQVSAPTIEKSGDLAAILSTIQAGDILFIDEIHSLNKGVEEILYAAMEDYKINVIIREEGMPKNITFDLPPFTIVGATTKPSKLSSPLRNRFLINLHFDYYKDPEIVSIIKRSAKVLGTQIDDDAAMEIAKRSKGVPRIGNRILKRVRDFTYQSNVIDLKNCNKALKALGIDDAGLDDLDKKVLETIYYNFQGGPVGIRAISSTIGEDEENILELSEAFLVRKGFIARTTRGRVITTEGIKHITSVR